MCLLLKQCLCILVHLHVKFITRQDQIVCSCSWRRISIASPHLIQRLIQTHDMLPTPLDWRYTTIGFQIYPQFLWIVIQVQQTLCTIKDIHIYLQMQMPHELRGRIVKSRSRMSCHIAQLTILAFLRGRLVPRVQFEDSWMHLQHVLLDDKTLLQLYHDFDFIWMEAQISELLREDMVRQL